MESGAGVARCIGHSCGWLYAEKKVDKLSPGSLKAWAGRSTHSSRPLLFSSLLVLPPPPGRPGHLRYPQRSDRHLLPRVWMLYVLSRRVLLPLFSLPRRHPLARSFYFHLVSRLPLPFFSLCCLRPSARIEDDVGTLMLLGHTARRRGEGVRARRT